MTAPHWLAFDAYALRNRAGIGSYTEGLLEALLAEDHGLEMAVFTAPGASSERFRAIPRSGEAREVRAPRWASHRVLFEEIWLPNSVGREGSEVLFNPDFTLPLRYRGKGVVTVHDLSFWDHPGSSSLKARILYGWKVPDTLGRARRVIADSAATARRIAERGLCDPGRVVRVHPGVGKCWKPLPGAGRIVKERWGLEPGYVLGVGTVEPRKNWEAVGRALDAPQEPFLNGLHFALCGGTGRGGRSIQERLERMLPGRVHFLSGVEREDLRALYRAAALFVYPSRYEGFGLPILEAMACGTPVVTSNVSSLPEAAGGAARLVDPEDAEALGRAVSDLVRDRAKREACRRRGLRRVRRASWAVAARKIWEVLRRVREEH